MFTIVALAATSFPLLHVFRRRQLAGALRCRHPDSRRPRPRRARRHDDNAVITYGDRRSWLSTVPAAGHRDLGDVTVMPGMIDVHVHIDWHFRPNGLYGNRAGQPAETPEQTEAAIQANLDAMLDAGFTTVQSLGAASDEARRDAIAAGTIAARES